jgi:tetratricopeptide (TPR) repeat protein
MDNALVWPDPRAPDTLPQLQDAEAAEQAMGYLNAAMQRRPDHTHAYRLAGQIYAAQGNWGRAAEMWDHARALSPKNPLLAWEASLIYERMVQNGEAPVERVTAAWRDANMDANSFTARGDVAQALGRPEEAERWYARAALAGAAP